MKHWPGYRAKNDDTDWCGIYDLARFNSVNLDCDGKFWNVKDSYMVLRRMNDDLCRVHGLSVIENPKTRSRTEGETAAVKYGVSFKERLRQTIDRVIPDSDGFEDFLARMRSEGYEIKQGKYLEFRAPEQVRFTRSFRLGTDYTRETLQDRCGHRRGYADGAKRPVQRTGKKINPIIDIQAKLAAGKGAGYEPWATVFNLKEAAKTLNFLIDNNLTDYDELAALAERVGNDFDASSRRIKVLEGRMAEIAQLKTHIIQYSKTREIYAVYIKSRHKKEFRAEHETEIAQHEAAKKAFDTLGGKSIPKVAQLSQEYAALLAEKQAEYEKYKGLRQDMIAYRTAKQNVDKILGIEEQAQETSQEKHLR